MPDNQALQVFYGTLPMIAVIAGVFVRSQTTLTDILNRLRALEAAMHSVDKRLVVIETRMGVIHQS